MIINRMRSRGLGVKHLLGKEEITGSNPVESLILYPPVFRVRASFADSTFWVYNDIFVYMRFSKNCFPNLVLNRSGGIENPVIILIANK